MDGSSKYFVEALEKQELKSKMPSNVYVVKRSNFPRMKLLEAKY
jgi:hypothetical protein